MDAEIERLRGLYERFNARDVEGVLAHLVDEVAWANGMHGGHVRGREAVRDYWTRQWSVVQPHVEPLDVRREPDGALVFEVRQTVRDLDGRPLQGPDHGLSDRIVLHVFRLRDGRIARVDIRDDG